MEFSETELTNDVERSERGQFNGATTHEAERSEREQYGERLRYDPAGPYQKTRTRTDFCWLIGFILFIVVWLIIIIYGFSKGDANKWFEPMDSEGRVCGKDPGVEERPYLVRYNNDTCDDCLICWTSCPEVDFLYSDGVEENHEPNLFNSTELKTVQLALEKAMVNSLIDKLEKKTEIDEKIGTGEDKSSTVEKTAGSNKEKRSTNDEKAGKDEKKPEPLEVETLDSEASTNAKKTSENETITSMTGPKILGSDDNDNAETRKKSMICKPEVQLELIQNLPELDQLVMSKKCAKLYHRTLEPHPTDRRCNNAHAKIEHWRYKIARMSRDLSNTKYSITGFVFISAVLALISIFAMRWFALFFICGSIFVTCAVLFYLIYDKIVSDTEERTTGRVLLALFVCIVLVASIVLLVLYFRKQIFKTCKMIKECSKAITDLFWTLLFSLLIAFIYGMILSMGVNLYFSLSSIDTPIYQVHFESFERCICPPELGYTTNASCDPTTFDSNCFDLEKGKCAASGCYLVTHKPRSLDFLHFINYVGLCWSFWFCLGFLDAVLASVFSNWYWTFNKKILNYLTLVESFWTVGFYHLGTIAFGSIIILICEIIRFVLRLFCRILEKINRPCSALILMHMKWVYDLLETFMNYINSRAYVACAMHGTDFLHSARSAYYLIMRNINKVHKVTEISNWLTFVLAVMISAVISKISVGYYQSREDEVTFAGVPSFFVFAGSLLVTWLMLRVVQVAVETIYQCFLEDSERNDGSCDKPFFASEQLSKVLYCKRPI